MRDKDGVREIQQRMELLIERAGGVRHLARKWKCSPAMVSDLRHGHRTPGPRLQKLLGIKISRVTTVVVEAL